MKRSVPWVASSLNSSAGMKNQPRLMSSGRRWPQPLPVMVRKLLSFSTKRASLEMYPTDAWMSALARRSPHVGAEIEPGQRLGRN
jgi:hypothetical protein